MKIELINPECVPFKKHDTDAGYDLKSNMPTNIELRSGCSELIHTGVKIEIPTGYCGLVIPRSSLGNKGIILKNIVGVIDSEYRGEILVKILNLSPMPITIERYERFVQIIFVPVLLDTLEIVESVSTTARGENGFGSTGK